MTLYSLKQVAWCSMCITLFNLFNIILEQINNNIPIVHMRKLRLLELIPWICLQVKLQIQNLMQVLSKFTALVPPVASPLSLTLPSTLLSSFILVFFPFPLTWVRKQIVTSMDRISIKMIIVLIPVQQNKMESRYRSFCPRLYTERRANREKRKENSPGLNKTLAQEKLHSCFEILTESRYQ